MGHFVREYRAPRNQDRGRREDYRQGSKVEEQAPKKLMAINEVGWDWSYMANDEENYALVTEKEAPTEFTLMANTSAESKVFDNFLCSKDYKKNTDSLNSKITNLTDKLFDANNMIYHYKLGLAQVESRLVEHREREIKYCEKIRGFKLDVEFKTNSLECLAKKLETLKKEKEGLDGKLAGFQTASKDLDSLLESQRLDKNKEGLGYSAVPLPPAQLYSSPKKDLSWTGLLEFKDDTMTDYSRPAPTVESSPDDAQNRNSSKGIKREFSNARTRQQNGVAERRNRTLIEAARTMLADAKLPITFWAETVNTACYVQNRVLVNKSQNKTPYELFNGRTPTIGFLKPFGCHVMILNTLENIGKFKEKGDEGYFIGYSMSSKAFRVFNKRTKKVEENLHVEFLENKAIEKGAGPNWLFDIDSLTKSMNYVPVDAGTNSTNLSGTKDAARQEVKNDVSSLRYIALPNWLHDAILESSSSKPQDDCSTDVPESSGISNPTATSTNPSADQLETLTVETLIPTVSSPVLTACFTDSLEPSSDARLI
nr:retrovirus-related Pol polyprotein from transposon TNT 1-94 [Tanacetum cinerariifolium]